MTKLCPSYSQIILYSYEAEFIAFGLNSIKTVGILVQFHIHTGISRMFCQLKTPSTRFTWVRCILLNFRPKTRQRATLLPLTWISSCRSKMRPILHPHLLQILPISISISQTFRSGAIFHLRPPMAFLSQCSP